MPPEQKPKPSESGAFTATLADTTSIVYVVNAQLVTLPAPLRLKVPIIATVETWSDGVVAARFPAAALYGEAATDTEALRQLGIAVFDFVNDLRDLQKENPIGGGLLEQWNAVLAVVEVPDEME